MTLSIDERLGIVALAQRSAERCGQGSAPQYAQRQRSWSPN